jgi:hypothetical protein
MLHFSPSSFCKWVLVYISCQLPPSNHDKLIIITLVIHSSLHLLCILFLPRRCHHNSYLSFRSKFLRFLSFELIILWSQNIVQRNQGILLFNVMHSSMQVFCSLLFPQVDVSLFLCCFFLYFNLLHIKFIGFLLSIASPHNSFPSHYYKCFFLKCLIILLKKNYFWI